MYQVRRGVFDASKSMAVKSALIYVACFQQDCFTLPQHLTTVEQILLAPQQNAFFKRNSITWAILRAARDQMVDTYSPYNIRSKCNTIGKTEFFFHYFSARGALFLTWGRCPSHWTRFAFRVSCFLFKKSLPLILHPLWNVGFFLQWKCYGVFAMGVSLTPVTTCGPS